MLSNLKLKFLIKTLLLCVVFILVLAKFCLIFKENIRRLSYSSSIRQNVVKVQGKVYYDDYKREDIIISWRKDLTRGSPIPVNRPLVIRRIPASYSLYIPKAIGSFYLCARGNVVHGENKNNSVAYFVSDLIMIDPKKDKILIDIYLKKRKIVMDSYKGRTIKISGRIRQEKYKRGFISVTIETPDNHRKVFLPPDIAKKFLIRPGDYAIDIPANIGYVYINALNYPDKNYYGDMPRVIFASYKDNPVSIGNSDIEGIDIVFE